MIDDIKDSGEKKSPVSFDQIEQAEREAHGLKPIDKIVMRRVYKLKVSYKKSKKRIRLEGQKVRRKRRIFLAVIIICFLIFGGFLIARTRFFQTLLFVYKLRHGSYLVGFQNSAELRPTGGFWGSFAVVDVPGNIQKSTILFDTNPYKKDNLLLKETNVPLPGPMVETYPNRPQSFINANWSVDFREAAKTLEWYFGLGWDKKIDGVVGISSLSVIDLLKLIGPVTLKDGTVVISDNFTQIMSQKIDVEYWQDPENIQANEPKTVLFELVPEIIAKTKKQPAMTLYRFLVSQMEEGRIVTYFNDPAKQKLSEGFGISGELNPYSVDYLAINNTNLNGGKTSLNVDQSIDYAVSTDAGKTVADLTIKRTHRANTWPEILNRNYTRVFAPLGSKLVSIDQTGDMPIPTVDTNDELGRTSFGFWFSTSSGEEKTTHLKYELPVNLKNPANYSLVLQKQPGTLVDNINITAFGNNLYVGNFDQNLIKLR